MYFLPEEGVHTSLSGLQFSILTWQISVESGLSLKVLSMYQDAIIILMGPYGQGITLLPLKIESCFSL